VADPVGPPPARRGAAGAEAAVRRRGPPSCAWGAARLPAGDARVRGPGAAGPGGAAAGRTPYRAGAAAPDPAGSGQSLPGPARRRMLSASEPGRRGAGGSAPLGGGRAAGGAGWAPAVRSARGDAGSGGQAMSSAATYLWVVVPYTAIAAFVAGHLWRYRYDKFGWTTRSTQL